MRQVPPAGVFEAKGQMRRKNRGFARLQIRTRGSGITPLLSFSRSGGFRSGAPNRAMMLVADLVAGLPIGSESLASRRFAKGGGVKDWPVFHLKVVMPGQVQRGVLAGRGQGNDQVELPQIIAPLHCISSKLRERWRDELGPQARLTDGNGKAVHLHIVPHAGRLHVNPAGRRTFSSWPSAMGDRTALWSQQNRTDLRSGAQAYPPMQYADQGEETPGGVDIDLGLAVEPFLQHPCAPRCGCRAGPCRSPRSGSGGRRLTASK